MEASTTLMWEQQQNRIRRWGCSSGRKDNSGSRVSRKNWVRSKLQRATGELWEE